MTPEGEAPVVGAGDKGVAFQPSSSPDPSGESYVCPNTECDGADGEVVECAVHYIPRRWSGSPTCPDCGTKGDVE